MSQTGRDIRCKRCKVNVTNSLNLDGWGVDYRDNQIVGYICDKCLKPNELQPAPEGFTFDVGHGYQESGPVSSGRFKFLKKKVDAPDYFGKREARLTWEEFSDMLRRIMEQVPYESFQIAIEIQTLWNFVISVEALDGGERMIRSTGYHTHGMKKGKQLDAELIENLSQMGMTPPNGDVRDWSIRLTVEESQEFHLNKVITHILDRGYEFNPNLFQSVEVDKYA
jgi:hypothetical protein